MKIQQETLPFMAITIKLEKKSEAEAFFRIMDCAATGRAVAWGTVEAELAKDLSDALTQQHVVITG